jgi:hypothetical protein
VAWETVTAGVVTQPEVVPVVEEDVGETPQTRVAAFPRQEAPKTQEVPTAPLTAILARLEMGTAAAAGVPAWLVEAIGNPLTYDAAAGNRKDVCARVDPALYRRLQVVKERLGLRTTAGRGSMCCGGGLAVGERGRQ